eukprot:1570780-Rhodomonas_salina.2
MQCPVQRHAMLLRVHYTLSSTAAYVLAIPVTVLEIAYGATHSLRHAQQQQASQKSEEPGKGGYGPPSALRALAMPCPVLAYATRSYVIPDTGIQLLVLCGVRTEK